MGFKKRVDTNQSEVVRLVRQIPGVTVAHTHVVGKGFPDLVMGYRGSNYLLEVKDGAKSRSRKQLTEGEKSFHQKWTGKIHVVEKIEDVLQIIK